LNGIFVIDGTEGEKLKFMASISRKWHKFFLAFQQFKNGASKFYSNNQKLVELWKKLAEQSDECISELAVFYLIWRIKYLFREFNEPVIILFIIITTSSSSKERVGKQG
jgi:hypothetical protein